MQPAPLPRFDELQSVIFHLINLGPIKFFTFEFLGSTFLEERGASTRSTRTTSETRRQGRTSGTGGQSTSTYISYLKEQVKQDGDKTRVLLCKRLSGQCRDVYMVVYFHLHWWWWALLGCTGLYWAVLGCTGLYWSLIG